MQMELDVYDWPKSAIGKKLASLELSFHCQICSEIYNNAMMLPCGHTYCSLCIQNHFDKVLNPTTSDICPSCRIKCEQRHLVHNRAISDSIVHYRAVRNELLHAVQSIDEISSSTVSTGATMIVRTGSSDIHKRTSMQKPVMTKKMGYYNTHGETVSKVKKRLEEITSQSRVKLRLDGDKPMLEKRMRSLIHLNNAQVGSLYPLTIEQIITELNNKESAREIEAKKAEKSASKVEDLKSGKTVPEFEDNFKCLLQKIKRHKAGAEKEAARLAKIKPDPDPDPVNALTSCSSAEPALAHPQDRQSYDWGVWSCLYSEKCAKPFFINNATGHGQFEIPKDLESMSMEDSSCAQPPGEDDMPVSGSQLPHNSRNIGSQGTHSVINHDSSSSSYSSSSSQRGSGSVRKRKSEEKEQHTLSSSYQQECIILDDVDDNDGSYEAVVALGQPTQNSAVAINYTQCQPAISSQLEQAATPDDDPVLSQCHDRSTRSSASAAKSSSFRARNSQGSSTRSASKRMTPASEAPTVVDSQVDTYGHGGGNDDDNFTQHIHLLTTRMAETSDSFTASPTINMEDAFDVTVAVAREDQDEAQAPEVEEVEILATPLSATPLKTVGAAWSCNACTFINESSTRVCEMCGSLGGGAGAGAGANTGRGRFTKSTPHPNTGIAFPNTNRNKALFNTNNKSKNDNMNNNTNRTTLKPPTRR